MKLISLTGNIVFNIHMNAGHHDDGILNNYNHVYDDLAGINML